MCTALLLSTGVAWPEVTKAQSNASAQTYAIPAGDLNSVLRQFSQQSRVQLIYPTELADGKRSAGLSGSYTPAEALRRLLNGSGLESERVNDRTVVLKKAPALPKAPDPKPEQRTEATETNNDVTELDTIIVTGTSIQGLSTVPAPTISISREEIATRGYNQTSEIFEDLPQNLHDVTPSASRETENRSPAASSNLNFRTSGINLRGLGAGSTLTLVNGTRRAGVASGQFVDVSAIPLAMIDRVEIVTGGQSSIYGADAVAGVVNIITRREFEGADSFASVSFRDKGGGARFVGSQTVGMNGTNGGFVAAISVERSLPLDAQNTAAHDATGKGGLVLIPGRVDISPSSRRASAFFSGRYDLTENVEAFLDADSTWSNVESEFATIGDNRFVVAGLNSIEWNADTNQLSFGGGILTDFGPWNVQLKGGWSEARSDLVTDSVIELSNFRSISRLNDVSTLKTVGVIADGPLFELGDGTVKGAIGAEWRGEHVNQDRVNGAPVFDIDREVKSAFAELRVPLFGSENELGLEFSGSARFDDYSDFGSSITPQGGLIFTTPFGVRLKGSYSEAFRAPELVSLTPRAIGGLRNQVDGQNGGAIVPVLFISGNNPDVGPETAKSWTATVEFQPLFASWLKTSLSYYDISYKDRLAAPAIGTSAIVSLLSNDDLYPGFINRSPAEADLAEALSVLTFPLSNSTGTPAALDPSGLLAAFPNLVLFDNRTTNVAQERVRGIDFDANAVIPMDSGSLVLGTTITYVIEKSRRATPTSAELKLINEFGLPIDFRARATLGYKGDRYGAYLYLNHVAGYDNPFTTPATSIDSWTTADLSVTANVGRERSIDLTFAVKNVFNEAPPFVSTVWALPYDPANADLQGRYFSLSLRKRW